MLFLIWTVALADILPVRDTHVQTGRAPLYDEDVDKWWGNSACFSGDDQLHTILYDVSVTHAAIEQIGPYGIHGALEHVYKNMDSVNMLTSKQLHVRFEIATTTVISTDCDTANDGDIRNFKSFGDAPFKILLDYCPQSPYLGAAFVEKLCDKKLNRMIVYTTSGWTIWAHEIGHIIGAGHPFQNNTALAGTFGGIMDYGTNVYDGVVQFNKETMYQDICSGLDQAKSCALHDSGYTVLRHTGCYPGTESTGYNFYFIVLTTIAIITLFVSVVLCYTYWPDNSAGATKYMLL